VDNWDGWTSRPALFAMFSLICERFARAARRCERQFGTEGSEVGIFSRPTECTSVSFASSARNESIATQSHSNIRALRILILGGTGFVGRHLVAAALEGGHRVTLFNRGTHGDLFPGAEHLRGDRATGDLGALQDGRWDAAVDTACYLPAQACAAAVLLAGAVGHYMFVSTLSVYDDGARLPVGEDAAAALATPEQIARAEDIIPAGPAIVDAYGDLYGPLKASCEAAVVEAMHGRASIVRPGLIVGPHDYTDRFTYWPARLARGGEVLAPGAPDRPLQLIDARDLATWMVRALEAGCTGTFNASGPAAPITVGGVLEACRGAVGGDGARLTWVDDEPLLQAGIAPWTELPLWVPAAFVEAPQLHAACARARAAGLTFRPLAETIGDTLAWDKSRPASEPRRAGLDPARERALLEAWRTRNREGHARE
jgi:2'-hydroxyisoflavone reductase